MSPPDASSKTYSLKNFRQCEQLHQELLNVAVRKICGDILKLLLASKEETLVQTRNRMDIPHGLFGLKLDDFYDRRHQDIVYLDVLQMVCQQTLQRAKTCIVLDGLYHFINDLLRGYIYHNMEPIKQEIAKSVKLLTINEIITEEYRRNMIYLLIANNMLKEFHANRKAHIKRLNDDMNAALNNYMESVLVMNTLEFRTHVNYTTRTADQFIYELSTAEDALQRNLENIHWNCRKEEHVSHLNVIRQKIEINTLKEKITNISQEYDEQADYYDDEIVYHSNMIEIMRTRYNECVEKLPFFETEMVMLRQWELEQEQKASEEARALITADIPKKKKKKQKEERGVLFIPIKSRKR